MSPFTISAVKGSNPAPYNLKTDVAEATGLMTYDRKAAKTPASRLADLHQRLGPEIKR